MFDSHRGAWQSWPRKFGWPGGWVFCLIATPLRRTSSEHNEAPALDARSGFQLERGVGHNQGTKTRAALTERFDVHSQSAGQRWQRRCRGQVSRRRIADRARPTRARLQDRPVLPNGRAMVRPNQVWAWTSSPSRRDASLSIRRRQRIDSAGRFWPGGYRSRWRQGSGP